MHNTSIIMASFYMHILCETFSLSYILLKYYYEHLKIIHEQIEFCGGHIRISVFLNMHLLAGNAEVL